VTHLTSPQGGIELAIVALLLVLGYRLTRPTSARDWVGVAAYAAGLAGQLLGASGLLGGSVAAPGVTLRVLGAVALVGGLVVAGAPARARRRAIARAGNGPRPTGVAATHAGLALVLAGQFLRGPSASGLMPVAVGVFANAALFLGARRGLKSVSRAQDHD
jgi:hypothetical protein